MVTTTDTPRRGRPSRYGTGTVKINLRLPADVLEFLKREGADDSPTGQLVGMVQRSKAYREWKRLQSSGG